jgi:hypothetical protein
MFARSGEDLEHSTNESASLAQSAWNARLNAGGAARWDKMLTSVTPEPSWAYSVSESC